MGSSIFFDAIVVGGGPAGGAAAISLARAGWRTALLERQPRNRFKTCGHCLSHHAWPLLQHLGIAAETASLARGRIHAMRLHLPRSIPLHIPLIASADQSEGLLIERSRFDQWLIDRAARHGAEILQPTSLRSCSLSHGAARIEIEVAGRRQTLSCGLIVGADGLRSRVAQAANLLPRRRSRGNFGFCLGATCSARSPIEPGVVEMFLVNGGYLGIVRIGSENLHIAGLIRKNSAVTRHPLEFSQSVVRQCEFLRDSVIRFPSEQKCQTLRAAGPMPWSPVRRSCAAVALVGDAAGFVEPFTGEGMTWALHSALLLGEIAAQTSPGHWTARQASDYERLWRRNIGRAHRRCRSIGFFLRRPRLTRMAALIVRGRPKVAQRMAELVVAP